MPHIRQIDKMLIDKLFGMEGGYVLNFSDRTMAEFFARDLSIDIYDPSYAEDGTSKARRLRCFLHKVDAASAVRVLNALWQYRETERELNGLAELIPTAQGQFLNLLNRLQANREGQVPQAAPVPAFHIPDYTALLGELMGLHSIHPQQRGYAFEGFLKKLFNVHGLLARGGFRTTGEQIDGSFHLAGETYLLEAKWQNSTTPAADLFIFQGKIRQRTTWARGLFVSYSGFTADGLVAFGRGGSVICMDGLDLQDALHGQIPLNHVLEQKVRRSVETGDVLTRVRDLFRRAT
jgi:hypothetical protein